MNFYLQYSESVVDPRKNQQHIYDALQKEFVNLKQNTKVSAIRPFIKFDSIPSELGMEKIELFEDVIGDKRKNVHSGHKCQSLCIKAYFNGNIKAVNIILNTNNIFLY